MTADGPLRLRHFLAGLVVFGLVLLGGTAAFAFLLDESFFRALYRSTVTISLTGEDTTPHTTGGRVATVVVILLGMAIYAYLAGTLVDIVTRGVLTGAWSELKRRRVNQGLRDHYIICGYGRVGRRVAQELRQEGVPYVVLDFNADALRNAREAGENWIHGTGTQDEDLQKAGIDRAKGLVASSDSDPDNLYITLSARAMRPDLFIVTRASDEDAARKMRRAGADRVVQPYSAAGQEMAKLVLRPQVAAFLDVVSTTAGPDIRLEEIEVSAASGRVGRSIRELRVRHDTGALIIAVRRAGGRFEAIPSPDTVLEAGDVLIAVGTDRELQALEERFQPREPVAG
ncbi:MAG TPA: NAD-binding protein [Gaiellaceae bacterium]|nr:NAD-binding protein [Gaiellaceae bacterium]